MKNLIIPAVLIGGLTLFSFTSPSEGGVKKIGKHLYEVRENTRFSDADRDFLNDLIIREYKLTDTQLKQAMTEGIELNVLKKGWILKKKFSFMGMIDENFITWDDNPVLMDQIEQVEKVLDNYVK